jgi:tRNA nucleotidyltransferase (CCA-adding enzyme)
VRDLLLGGKPHDWDVVVAGPAAVLVRALAKIFSARVVEHPRFMTYTLHFSDRTFLDIATARTETYPVPGGLPVVRPADLEADAQRRDFSANALYVRLHPHPGALFDPTGGQVDLTAGRLRLLHDQSLVDDPTRLFRAARYAGRYAWGFETATEKLIADAIRRDLPASVSLVRLRHELFHLLEEEDPVPGLQLLWEWGAWKYWDPQWTWSDGLARAVRAVPRDIPPAQRLAAFLGPDPIRVRDALHRFSTPGDLKKKVLAFVSAGPSGR